ncbi:hypothetical protein PG911_08645 [Tenacibaculum ovolyticum]|uniref:hypothetical protein n=1 Tax=Tenacibaculum ovolyticum TaxID=104270 RepID=UPI0022F3FE32|nr:hypothetical protein [Tenacibaculum ovolyticum]WBX78313.1 hypothetical protein PG911_08645 [Tenacibaculum ovolyticum]
MYLKLGSEYYNLATNSKDTTVTSTNNFRVRESQIEVLGTKIFTSTRSENIKSLDEDNYTLFAEYLNKAFTDYDIDTCIRKIHFLAQCYHESSKFHHTYEGKTTVPSNYKGGVDFQGRGIKQITHDYNYLACYDEQERIIHEESSTVAPFIPLFDIYIDKRDNINQSVTAYLAKYGNTHGFPDLFLETLKDFSKKITENLKDACISAGFFWKHQDEEVTRLYEAADNDNVQELTNKINGGVTGLSQRQKYTDDLKIIFDYENCEKNQ